MAASLLPDVSTIKGNLTPTQKRRAAQTLCHFIGTPDTSFGAEIGAGLKLVQIDVFRSWSRARGESGVYGPGSDSGCDNYDGDIVGVVGGKGDVKGLGGSRRQISQISQISRGGDGKELDGSLTEFEGRTICEIQVTKNMCNVYGTLHGGCAAYLIDPCSVSAIVGLGIVTGMDGTGVSQSMNIQWHRPAKVGTKLRIISSTVSVDGYIRSARCELRDSVDNTLYVSAVHSTINVKAKTRTLRRYEPVESGGNAISFAGIEGEMLGKAKL